MTLNHVTVNCACGAHLASHWCPLVWTDPPAPTYTLDDVYTALSRALGGDLPLWVWDDVRGRLKGVRS